MIRDLLGAVGAEVGGVGPFDLRVHDRRFYDRVFSQGALGLGESYLDGWWDCDHIDQLVSRVLEQDLISKVQRGWRTTATWLAAQLMNLQTVARSPQVAHMHYDLGNEFFAEMLGRTMMYSCAYWPDATTLDAAQDAKLDLICRKLGIGPGDHVLDIGCGWGGFAHWAAKAGARVTGVTVSAPQAAHARALCAELPVDIEVMDYRAPGLAARGPFTKIVSLGMFEHVGSKNYETFMQIARDVLVPDGLMLLQTIGRSGWAEPYDAFTDRYILPNSMLPSMAEISDAAARRFVIEDWHAFGGDYDTTLMAWHANYQRATAARHPSVPTDPRFHRLWNYYLLSYAGSFRARVRMQLWQIVLAKRGVRPGYRSVR